MQKKEDALKGVKLFVLDMDGTVYLGNHMIDGALDFIHEVDASEDRDYIFFTNNETSFVSNISTFWVVSVSVIVKSIESAIKYPSGADFSTNV